MKGRNGPHEPNVVLHPPAEDTRILNGNGRKTLGCPISTSSTARCRGRPGHSKSFPMIGVVMEYGILATTANGFLGSGISRKSDCLTRMLLLPFILPSSLSTNAGSVSIASTCPAFSASGTVKAPVPAPISRTVSVEPIRQVDHIMNQPFAD